MRRDRASSFVNASWLLLLSLLLACAAGRSQVRDGLALDGRVLLASAPGQGGGAGGSGNRGLTAWQPLTVARLVEIAQGKGIGVNGARVTRNREMGVSFQGAVLRSLDVVANHRAFPTPNRTHHQAVIPDSLITAERLTLTGMTSFDPEGAFLEIVSDDFLDMLEVKMRTSPINLSTARGQIQGFLDALAARGRSRSMLSVMGTQPRRALLLVTTSDTQIAEEVSWEGARRGIAIYQSKAREADGWITVGPFVQKTSFSDVPPQFQMASKPTQLAP